MADDTEAVAQSTHKHKKKTHKKRESIEEQAEPTIEEHNEDDHRHKHRKHHKRQKSHEAEQTEDVEKKPKEEKKKVGPTHDLDVNGVVESFQSCLVKSRKKTKHDHKEDIRIERFVQAFYDLLPILRLLGTAFYFVEKDIVQKLTHIKANQEAHPESTEVKNLLDFVHWECENNTVRTKHSTARHALRLMRALHFISLFLEKLNDPTVEPRPAAKDAYEKSLTMFHPWSVRTAVGLAFYTLPHRSTFLNKLELDPRAPDVFMDFVEVTTKIRTILNGYYDQHQLQDLP